MTDGILRRVRCPKCLTVLPEPSDAPVYRCGNCDTRLRAKPPVRPTDDSDEPVREGKPADSDASAVAPDPPSPNPNDSRNETADRGSDHSDYFLNFRSPAKIPSIGYYDDGISSADDARALGFPIRGYDAFRLPNRYDNRRWRREKWHRHNEHDAMEMIRDMKRISMSRERMPRRYDKMAVIRPLGGAAPFVACSFCLELLILPSDFLLYGKRRRKVKCAACREVCCFSLIDGSLVPIQQSREFPLHRLMGYSTVSQVIGRKGASSSRTVEKV